MTEPVLPAESVRRRHAGVFAQVLTRTYANGDRQRRLLVFSRLPRRVARVWLSAPLGRRHSDGGGA